MRTIKLTLAYDGTGYAGWQWQARGVTLQGTLEEALAKISGQHSRVLASGRTDAGVHALGQVVSWKTSCSHSTETLRRALNAELPDDIVVLSVEEAAATFHPTHDVRRKRYRYLIHDGRLRDVFLLRYSWHSYRPLDAEAMHRAAQWLLGTHDFRSFETRGSPRVDSVRTVYEIGVHRGLDERRDVLTVEIEADGFLYHMVRTIAGSLVEIGRGLRPEEWLRQVLEAKNRRAAGRSAPAQGLCLVRVIYDDCGPNE